MASHRGLPEETLTHLREEKLNYVTELCRALNSRKKVRLRVHEINPPVPARLGWCMPLCKIFCSSMESPIIVWENSLA